MAAEGIVLAIALAMAAAQPPASQRPAAPAETEAISSDATGEPVTANAAPIARAGALVIIEVAQTISSKVQKPGDTFPIRLASAVTAGGVVLIPVGAMGMGEVVDAAPSGALGRPAKLVLAARYLEHDGVRIPLRAMKLGAVGKDNTGVVMATAFVPYVGILGAFIHGGEIDIPSGSYASAKLATDVAAPMPPVPAMTTAAAAPPATEKKPEQAGVGP